MKQIGERAADIDANYTCHFVSFGCAPFGLFFMLFLFFFFLFLFIDARLFQCKLLMSAGFAFVALHNRVVHNLIQVTSPLF